MGTVKVNSILKQVLEKIKPSKDELKEIDDYLGKFLKEVKKRIKIMDLNVEVFVGGSFAKHTVIKKDYYDVDVFLRFDKKYKDEEISNLASKILKGFKNVSVIHGSRDYFRIKAGPSFYIELIPVMKIKNPKEAENTTDLSYSHVRYINKKIKGKLLDEVLFAKAFCHANQAYGAESYIRGFSGYSIELLVLNYKGFLKFIKAMTKIKEGKKEVIDLEKLHKNKARILLDLNASKLHSPIILVDPTYKQRNTLAALSDETFKKFQKDCKQFLKNPSIKAFEIKKTDLNRVKRNAEKNNNEFILLEAQTDRQEEDIAGSKLLKFYNHLDHEIKRYFFVKNKGFNYNKKKSARYFFVAKSKEDILITGPDLKDPKNVNRFQEKHKNYFTKKGRVYSKENVDFSVKQFIGDWKKKNKKRIKDMSIKGLEVVE